MLTLLNHLRRRILIVLIISINIKSVLANNIAIGRLFKKRNQMNNQHIFYPIFRQAIHPQNNLEFSNGKVTQSFLSFIVIFIPLSHSASLCIPCILVLAAFDAFWIFPKSRTGTFSHDQNKSVAFVVESLIGRT